MLLWKSAILNHFLILVDFSFRICDLKKKLESGQTPWCTYYLDKQSINIDCVKLLEEEEEPELNRNLDLYLVKEYGIEGDTTDAARPTKRLYLLCRRYSICIRNI